jgi:uncharacterized protein involved in exopolysaccharide biosynthesis
MNESVRLLKPFFRGLPIIIAVMVLSVLAAKKYLTYVTPMYEATAKLKLADVHDGVPGSNLFKDLDVFASSNKIAAEIELMKSELLIGKTLDKLDFGTEVYRIGKVRSVELYHESPFVVQTSFNNQKGYDHTFGVHVISDSAFVIQAGAETINGKFGEVITCSYGSICLTLNRELFAAKHKVDLVGLYEFKCLSAQSLLNMISTHIDINPVDKDVAVIRITFQSPVKEKAAAFVNKLAEVYIHDYIESKYKAAGTTVSFLDKQIDGITDKLHGSENRIEDYRNQYGITNIRQETETDLRSIAQMKIQLSNEKMTVDAMKDLSRYIRSGKDRFLELAPNFEAFTDLLSTEIVKNIKQLQAEKKDLLLTYTPEEEKVKVIDRKIEDLKDYLVESIGNTLRNHEVKYERLQKEIAEAERAFIGIPGKEKQLNSMNRDFELYQKSYNFLNEKKIEAEIARAARISFHRVIEHAIPPANPVSPNRAIIIIVSGILGMIVSVILIYSVHAAKAKVNDSYTIENNSRIPVAFAVPVQCNPQQSAETFHKLALQLELKNMLHKHSVIAVSSFSNGEGKCFFTTGLVQELALQQKKVLLLSLGENNSTQLKGVTHKILDHTTMATMNAAVFSAMLDGLKREFETVIVKNDNVLNRADSLLCMGAADVNLFILDSRKTPARYILQADLLKEEYRFPNMHFVLNRAGYNPGVVMEIWKMLRLLIKRFQK